MPQGIEIKTLDDLPGFASQDVKPGMQIAPLTPPSMPLPDMDVSGITPAFDPSQIVSSLNAITAAQQEHIAASADALRKNTIVSQQVYDETVKAQDDVMGAYERLQRIERNPVADLFALFDPKTWSAKHQMLDIEKAQLRSNSVTMRGQAQININNQLPALKQTEVQIAQTGFENQQKFFGIVKDVAGLNRDEIQTRINLADLRLKMSNEERVVWDLKAKQLSLQQAKAQLKAAQSGKGEWAGKEGILEDIIQRHEKADLDAAAIRQNMANQRFDLAEKQMDSLISTIDFASGEALIQQALNSGANAITYRGIQIPLGRAIMGMEKVRKDTEAFEAAALARTAYGMNETLQTLIAQNSALALSGNGRSAQNLQTIRQFVDATPKDNPQAMQRLNAFLNDMKVRTAEDIKRAASVYKDPQAKAGFAEFAETGAFSPAGALPVVTEALGRNDIIGRSKFQGAWGAIQAETARRISQLNIDGMPTDNGSNQSAQQIMAWVLRNPNKKVDDIKNEIVQSGFAADAIRQDVTNVYRGDAMKNVLDGLSVGGQYATTFLNLIRQPQIYKGDDGRIDSQSLAAYLAQQSHLTGNKVDYLSVFIDGLNTYSTNAASMTADPSMTVEDQALLANSFGGDPRRNVTQEFISDMRTQAMVMREAMMKATQQDISGETQRRARALYPDLDPASLGVILQAVPSATGIGTAEETKAIFGTDPRFGNPPTSGKK